MFIYYYIIEIICPDLTITNGVVTISPADRGLLSRAFYECNQPGFALKGDGNRVCQVDSTERIQSVVSGLSSKLELYYRIPIFIMQDNHLLASHVSRLLFQYVNLEEPDNQPVGNVG